MISYKIILSNNEKLENYTAITRPLKHETEVFDFYDDVEVKNVITNDISLENLKIRYFDFSDKILEEDNLIFRKVTANESINLPVNIENAFNRKSFQIFIPLSKQTSQFYDLVVSFELVFS